MGDDCLDSHDEYFGHLNDISNDGENLVKENEGPLNFMVTHWYSTFDPLLDVYLYKIKFKDGTTNKYFSYVIAENLYLQFGNKGKKV